MITSGDKYESVLIDDVYRVFMRLKIRNLEKKDFGMYRCIARNFLGETDGSVHLYGKKRKVHLNISFHAYSLPSMQ